MRNLPRLPLTALLVSTVLLALPGCRLEIKVPEGGAVVSTDGAYVCEAGQTCVIDVVDLFFDQTFVAEPAPGHSFAGWRERGNDQYLCGGEFTPCRLATAGFDTDPTLQTILESDETFVLEPRFSVILGYCPDEKLIVSPGPPPN